jgi:hypothetical protein
VWSISGQRILATVLGATVVGIASCGAGGGAGEAGSPATGTGIAPEQLEAFIGNGLRFSDDGDFGLDIAQLVEEAGAPGGRLLRVFYPQGSASRGTNGPEGGMQAYLTLPSPVDVVELTYQVRFPTGFDFVKGGKLPGMYGGTVTSGRKIPDGTDGFSTRYMWRAGGAGEVYAYLPTSQKHGTSLGRGCWTFPAGQWTSIRQRVQLNIPGAADGRVTVWQDGRLVLDKGGLQFRTVSQLQIDGVLFSTFFGGDDSSWASPVDQHADFAAFSLAPGAPPGPTAPTSGNDRDCGTPGAP